MPLFAVAGAALSGGNILISWADTNSGSGATFTYWYDQVSITNSMTGQLNKQTINFILGNYMRSFFFANENKFGIWGSVL